ncbi:hypothetical protein K1X13_12195 [Nocardioides sp. WL0053]|uniref:Uncharacterized protein n=1 Tax=Nocardioides jiangsuensis TaxID=2866161 RepID=A0ABS7RKJ8_9ACTN|nr:hypothetical protein [Nocardioides jiangsuensis]MBY9075584.1 hypothetical protein [Nocardioides jiangsuensis]
MRTTDVVDRPWRSGTLACVAMMGWLSVVLWLDRASASGGLAQQRLLGVATWLVLLVALRRVSPMVRAQTAVVVVFATVVEYVFSPTLEVYLYRFDNVPMYVPPGHGLVYLSAYALGHARFVERHLRACTAAVLVVGGLWAGYGLFLAERPDALGAFWYACLVGFLLRGPSTPVYVGAFVAVSYLELVGTELRTWVWQSQDPTGWVSIGNPPSGAAGGYGWFDLAGLLAAPYLVAWFGRGGGSGPGDGGPGDGGVSPRRRRSRPTGPARPEPVRPGAVDVH